MTFLGKILVITQVIFSLIFMAFAGAVFQREETWKKKYDVEHTNLVSTQSELQSETAGRQEDKEKATKEVNDAKRRAETAEVALGETTKALDAEKKLHQTTAIERTNFQSQAEVAEREARIRRDETEKQLQINRKLIQDQETMNLQLAQGRKRVFDLEQADMQRNLKQDSLLAELAASKEKNRKLEEMVAKYNDDSSAEALAEKQLPPPVIDGRVVNTKKDVAKGMELVEISLGSDDGLNVGHTLYVSRGDKYLGQIKLVVVTPDKAVGTVVKAAKNGIIAEGDYVTTKL